MKTFVADFLKFRQKIFFSFRNLKTNVFVSSSVGEIQAGRGKGKVGLGMCLRVSVTRFGDF